MVRTRSSPGDSQPVSASSWAPLPPVAVAVCAIAAVVLVAAPARGAVGLCGLLAVLAVSASSTQAARRGRTVAELRARNAQLDANALRRLDEQRAETIRLAEVLLPAAIERLHGGDSVEEVLRAADHRPGLDPAFQAAHAAVLASVVEAVKAEEDLRDSAQRAFVNIARRVQAIVHQQFQDLRDMEDRHGGDPEVFGDLLHLDHGTALIGRLADSIAVLGGSRPGRQWQQDVPLFNVLRGAMSRIIDYQRVDLHSVIEVAVVGPAVEPLIHTLAELLDNATRYSPPHTRVHLTAAEVQSGIAIEVEDGGVGLSEEARVRAERVLSHVSAGLDLADLGETPRLGLSVVGRLAQANRLQVSLRQSAYAGVRAVVVIPRELITTIAVAPGTSAGAVVTPAPRRVADRPPKTPFPQEVNDNGLPPQRRRSAPVPLGAGSPAGALASANGSSSAPKAAARPAVEPGLWLAAFQSGVSGEPAAHPPTAAPPAPAPLAPAADDQASNKEGEQP
jgi:signal transduction histidine kinase